MNHLLFFYYSKLRFLSQQFFTNTTANFITYNNHCTQLQHARQVFPPTNISIRHKKSPLNQYASRGISVYLVLYKLISIFYPYFNLLSIPLHQSHPLIPILRSVICRANSILRHMCKLAFNGIWIKQIRFVYNCTE